MQKFKIARLRKGWSQMRLARAVGLSESKISKIETGRQTPDAALRQKFAAVLGLTIWELFPAVTESDRSEVSHG